MSKIPPLTLNWATSSTIGTRSNPIDSRWGGQLLGPSRISVPHFEPSGGECARKLGALEERSTGGDQDTEIALADSLQRLHPLAGDLGVGFGLAKTFSGRVKRYRVGFDQCPEVSQPPLGACNIITDQHVETMGDLLSQCGHDHGVAGSVQTRKPASIGRSREVRQNGPKFIEGFDDGEELGERHGAR
ncbi:MAG TPA: hypothetical protein VLJ83_10105 [Gemmatimonadaceae bacterium]|nr:hypothetical protein [Gemmatimonadaceae bacterium]